MFRSITLNPYISLMITAWKYAKQERGRYLLIYSMFAASNIINAGINTGCTNATQTITFNSPTIKSLTITYNSLGLDPTYGTDPDPEYIIIGSITSTGCIILPTSMAGLRVECTSLGPKIQWESTSEAENANFEVLGSIDAIAFTPLGKVEAENRRAEWTDQEGIVQFYRLRRTLANGDSEESAVIPAPFVDAFKVLEIIQTTAFFATALFCHWHLTS